MRTTISAFAIAIAALLLTGCPTDSPVSPSDPNAGTITVGDRAASESFSLPPGGGSVSSSPASGGITITTPADAFSQGVHFTVSAAPVVKHTFGTAFHPLTPLIRIDNGGGYAKSPFTITIPISLPPNHFAMGFFYDEETGELEGIPASSLANDAITLLTAHVEGRRLSDGTKGGIQGSKSYVDLIVASVDKNELSGIQNTNFTPGVDDWEFTNYGSYIAPGGHCAGQSISAMWYFTMKKQREHLPALYNRYSMTENPKLWQDNSRGYRLASVVQSKLDWDNRVVWLKRFDSVGTSAYSADSLHYLSFVYGMKITGKPQYVTIRGEVGGHALIAYKAGQGKVWVADPNYPGKTNREITVPAGSTFSPYYSGANASSLGHPFPRIRYVAKTAMINHEGIDAEWKKLEKSTIGDDIFPEWQLFQKNPETNEFEAAARDTLFTDADGKISLQVRCPSCEYQYPSDNLIDAVLYTPDGNKFGSASAGTITATLTNTGEKLVGLYAYGSVNAPTKKSDKYIDFKWFTIMRKGLTITPADTTVDVGAKVKFIARTNGTAPKRARFDWYFPESEKPISVTGDSTISHIFEEGGQFTIGIILHDLDKGKDIDTATTTITVGAPWRYLFIQIADYSIKPTEENKGPILMSDGSRSNFLTFLNAYALTREPCDALVWNGDSFSATIECRDRITSQMTSLKTGTISGTLSKDKKMITTVTVTMLQAVEFTDGDVVESMNSSITLNNIPLGPVNDEDVLPGTGAVIYGTKAVQYVKSLTYNLPANKSSLERVDWGSGKTKLIVNFRD